MTELLLVIIVQLGFVLNRLHKKGDSAKERIRSLRTRAEGERRVRRFPASRVARLRVCVHFLGARAHLLTSLRQRKDAVSSSTRRRMGAHRVSRPVRREGATQRLFRIADIKSVAEIVG